MLFATDVEGWRNDEARGKRAGERTGPRVLVSAPSPKQSSSRKVREGEAPSPAREGACAPQNLMQGVLEKLGIAEENPGAFDGEWRGGGGVIEKVSPIDGK